MAGHPDLESEQAYIDHAYACLEATRTAASKMSSMVEVGRGGTNQARYERDVIWEAMLTRLTGLQLGDAALCFGRIDFEPEVLEVAELSAAPADYPDHVDSADMMNEPEPQAMSAPTESMPCDLDAVDPDPDGPDDDPPNADGQLSLVFGGNGNRGDSNRYRSSMPTSVSADGNGSNGNGSNGNGSNGNGSNGNGQVAAATPVPVSSTAAPPGESYYIGRIAVSDNEQEVMIVDWRAPIAEPFYRATGRAPMGLVRRRHFSTRGRTLLNIEDELFGDAIASLGLPAGAQIDDDGRPQIRGHGALISALETTRTGKLGDIVATIQGEQDEIIRAEMPGVLVVQGGPGTGKTVVALHRAAYLLYTFRFPLEGQGVLVIGPNRLFLGYIEQVLPSLGEAGVELAVLADLVADVAIQGYDKGATARIKGDLRMVRFLARAMRDRQLPLREDLVLGYGLQHLRFTEGQSRRIIDDARRRFRKHNAGRRHVEAELFQALARSGRGDLAAHEVRERMRHAPEIREALERMWPVLTPAQFLHDLFGATSLLKHAARDLLSEGEWRALSRPRSATVEDVVWTNDDAPLLDEAREILGTRPKSKRQKQQLIDAGVPTDDSVRTFGHIVVDEAQDLSPMQLLMLERRSLGGSMTIVGDIAQSTGQWAHANWQEILDHLPEKRAPRRAELTVGYRLPAPNMALAARVLRYAAPDLQPPRSIREDGDEPRFTQASSPNDIGAAVVVAVRVELEAIGLGNIAVIVPASLVDVVADALRDAGIDHGRATRHGLDEQVTIVPVSLVKGLELDASVVVEPAAIIDEEPQGLRSLYVALTRATKRLAIVHARDLPLELLELPESD